MSHATLWSWGSPSIVIRYDTKATYYFLAAAVSPYYARRIVRTPSYYFFCGRRIAYYTRRRIIRAYYTQCHIAQLCFTVVLHVGWWQPGRGCAVERSTIHLIPQTYKSECLAGQAAGRTTDCQYMHLNINTNNQHCNPAQQALFLLMLYTICVHHMSYHM